MRHGAVQGVATGAPGGGWRSCGLGVGKALRASFAEELLRPEIQAEESGMEFGEEFQDTAGHIDLRAIGATPPAELMCVALS